MTAASLEPGSRAGQGIYGAVGGVAHHRSCRRDGDIRSRIKRDSPTGRTTNILFGLGVILGLGGLVAKILNRKDRPETAATTTTGRAYSALKDNTQQ